MKPQNQIYRKPHARYDYAEQGFICLICERIGFDKWVYSASEIVKHLKQYHKIKKKDQVILGWNEEFEKEYRKNRKKPLKYEYEKDSIIIDTTPREEYERERKRIEEERKAKREA